MQWQDFLFNLLSPLLLCHRTGNHLRSLSISGKTDAELVELLSSAPKLESARFSDPYTSKLIFAGVYIIAPDTVAKRSFATINQEYLSMELVRNNTCIPVPKAERQIKMPHRPTGIIDDYLVQQFIPGDPLHVVWSSLSWWKRFQVALTLHYYIYQLRSLRSAVGPPPFPGPPTTDGKPGRCSGQLFTDMGGGPFSSYHDLEKWYNKCLRATKCYRREDFSVAPFDSTSPLTFTHMDLHPRNIILGHDGQLWLIDWADAGWYPSWFEGVSMVRWAATRPGVSLSWRRMLPFITGSCSEPGQLPFINAILCTRRHSPLTPASLTQ